MNKVNYVDNGTYSYQYNTDGREIGDRITIKQCPDGLWHILVLDPVAINSEGFSTFFDAYRAMKFARPTALATCSLEW